MSNSNTRVTAKTDINAFTTKYQGISAVLINDVSVVCGTASYEAKALWDTGAFATCISRRFADDMHLVPTGKQKIQTPSGSMDVVNYLVDVILPNDVTVPDVVVFETAIGNHGFDLLIGMDIISLGDFAVSNYEQKTSFSFRIPSMGETDYTGD